jgi:processive 1,2-diacylglycerol beta-glucosyltransferase
MPKESGLNSRTAPDVELKMPKILILTATMGDGHNTAARNIRDALVAERGADIEVLVADPYTRTNPVINKWVQRGYATAINRYPHAWKMVFELLSRPGVVEGMGPMLIELTNAVKELIEEFQPDLVASTYPVFSFIMAKIRKRDPAVTIPFYTVITDSTMINSAWYRCPSDGAIVADAPSADALTKAGVDPAKVHVLGFPVGMAFENLKAMRPPENGQWKVLFFPGGRAGHSFKVLELLAERDNIEVTVVTGRRAGIFRRLQAAGLPRRGNLIGWTDDMPGLMASHHVFIGKAGGATVQEAIAAQIPFLVSHVVPGQEEGNIALIEQTGIGALAVGSPRRISDILLGLQANDGALWQAWRNNLAALKKPSAARTIARFLLGKI